MHMERIAQGSGIYDTVEIGIPLGMPNVTKKEQKMLIHILIKLSAIPSVISLAGRKSILQAVRYVGRSIVKEI